MTIILFWFYHDEDPADHRVLGGSVGDTGQHPRQQSPPVVADPLHLGRGEVLMISTFRQILERVLNSFHANLRIHHHFSVEDTLPEY